MEPIFTFRNLDATDAIREHTEQKLAKLKKYWYKPVSTHIILSVDHEDHRAEITVIDNGRTHIGHAEAPNMYTSIDLAIHKLEQQLRRRKDRATRHKGQPSATEVASDENS